MQNKTARVTAERDLLHSHPRHRHYFCSSGALPFGPAPGGIRFPTIGLLSAVDDVDDVHAHTLTTMAARTIVATTRPIDFHLLIRLWHRLAAGASGHRGKHARPRRVSYKVARAVRE